MEAIVYKDFACPFCYIGKLAAERLERETGIHFKAVFKEIHPDMPEEGCDSSVLFPPEGAAQLNRSLETYGADYDLHVTLGKRLSNSKKAILLYYYLEQKLPQYMKKFEDLVFQAYFFKHEDIGENGVLYSILEELDLNANLLDCAIDDEMANKALCDAEKQAAGDMVNMVPTFLVGRKVFRGMFPFEELKEKVSAEIKSKGLRNI